MDLTKTTYIERKRSDNMEFRDIFVVSVKSVSLLTFNKVGFFFTSTVLSLTFKFCFRLLI